MADGRVFTGAAAKSHGLIDALGGLPEARRWLDEKYAIPVSLPEKAMQTSGTKHWLDWLFSTAIQKSYFAERLTLDGLVSVWHPFVSSKW